MNLPKLRGNPKASKGQNFIRSRAFNYKQIFPSSQNYSDEEEKDDTSEHEVNLSALHQTRILGQPRRLIRCCCFLDFGHLKVPTYCARHDRLYVATYQSASFKRKGDCSKKARTPFVRSRSSASRASKILEKF